MVPTCPGKEEPVYPHTFNKQLRCNIIISLPAFLPSCSVCCLFFLPSRYNPGAPGSYQAGLSDYTWGLKRKKADKSKLTPINHIAFTKVLRQWEVCLDPTVTHFLAGRGQWWGEISEGLEDGEKRDPGFLAHEASDYEKKTSDKLQWEGSLQRSLTGTLPGCQGQPNERHLGNHHSQEELKAAGWPTAT